MAREMNPNSLANLEKSRLDKLPEERRKEIARMGAAATNKVKKEKKLFRDTVIELLERNVEGTDMTYQEAIVAAQIKKAMSGDTQAFNAVRDTGGQKPVDKVEAKVETTTIEVDIDE